MSLPIKQGRKKATSKDGVSTKVILQIQKETIDEYERVNRLGKYKDSSLQQVAKPTYPTLEELEVLEDQYYTRVCDAIRLTSKEEVRYQLDTGLAHLRATSRILKDAMTI